MNSLTKAFAALLLTAVPVAAQDANGDGMITMDELLVVYPDVTGEQFDEMDGNGDGALDADEMAAAIEAGMLPS